MKTIRFRRVESFSLVNNSLDIKFANNTLARKAVINILSNVDVTIVKIQNIVTICDTDIADIYSNEYGLFIVFK